jgi:nicotinate-nucleotide adenylyltransferase
MIKGFLMNIAVFGGAFDPPTIAHEAIVKACLAYPDFDELWLMPSGTRSDKPYMQSDELRLQMLELLKRHLFNSISKLKISNFELHLPRPTKTHTTIEALNDAYPGVTFCHIFGADSYNSMPTWEEGLALQQSLPMLLVGRAGYHRPAESDHIKHLEVKYAKEGVSSTLVRYLYSKNQSADKYINSHIRKFISTHQLYQRGTIPE